MRNLILWQKMQLCLIIEALMGYLYLTEQWERMLQLIKKGIEKGETDGREVPGK